MLPSTRPTQAQKRGAVMSICLSGSLLLLLPFNAPTETWAGQLTSGPNSEAAAAIERLEELRKTIKLKNFDWRTLRNTGGLPIND